MMNALLFMPVVSAAASRETSSISASKGLVAMRSRPRILYVDDDISLRQVGELVLGGSGYIVDSASDGMEALAALRKSHYDLLITDNQMPRLTGLELIRWVRMARMTVPIILASGMLGALPPEDVPLLECEAILPKPFTAEQLLASVEQVLQATAGIRGPGVIRNPVLKEFQIRAELHPRWGINE